MYFRSENPLFLWGFINIVKKKVFGKKLFGMFKIIPIIKWVSFENWTRPLGHIVFISYFLVKLTRIS